jgi:hypothetical protein
MLSNAMNLVTTRRLSHDALFGVAQPFGEVEADFDDDRALFGPLAPESARGGANDRTVAGGACAAGPERRPARLRRPRLAGTSAAAS